MVDFRHNLLTNDFIGLFSKFAARSLEKYDKKFNFVLVDMSNRHMFEYIAETYLIGNHDTPGILATQGEYLYFKNW